MKNLNTFFDFLLFPFIFLKNLSLFQRLSIPTQKERIRVTTRSLKFLFVMPLLLSSLMTIQAVADLDSENDTCPPGEYLTIGSGSNTFLGTIEKEGPNSTGVDYYQIIIPAHGNITITWETSQTDKEASLLVGTECNGSTIYDGSTPADYHETNTTTVSKDQPIFIKIYNGEDKDYTLTINLDVDIRYIDTYSIPSFCYEYYYTQGTTPLNETDPPRIEDNVTAGTAVDINLYIKNLGYVGDTNNSYINAENMIVDIIDINNTGEAIYTSDTTYLKKPGEFYRNYIPDIELTVSDAYIKGIEVGDVSTMESFAIDFSITPEAYLNFPLKAEIKYDLAVPVGNTYVMIPQEILLQNIPMCESNSGGYSPAYSIFNVEHSALSSSALSSTVNDPIYYNLPTQTAMRVDDLKIVSYKVDALHTRNPVQTIVSIELIDAGKHGDIIASCAQEDSVISPRVSVFITGPNDTNITEKPFNKVSIQDAIANGSISDQIYNPGGDNITSAAEFYSVAKENAAFRIIYNTLRDGELIQIVEGNNGLYAIANFPDLHQEYPHCKQPVKNPNNDQMTDLTSVACSDTGGNSTPADIAICMECLYGYNTRYLCSRDNFAIRPESFRVSLSDQDQESPAIQSHIKTNIDNDEIKIAAGYQYALDVNATNYLNDNDTLGYDRRFSDENASDDKHISFIWQNFSNDYLCNDITDHNKSMIFNNGMLESNLSNAQIGHYELEIVDNLWTRHDYDTTLLTHHSVHPVHGPVSAYFISGKDCVPDVTTVPLEGTVAGSDNTSITNVSGCEIKSEHTRNNGTVTQYTNINTMIYPYKFDLNGSNPIKPMSNDPIKPMIGPYTRTNGQTFVYIDTPPTMDENNTNMSYNLNGTFFAAGYHDVGTLSNFVTGCYAYDLNMVLNFTYNSPAPASDKTPFLSYSLKDHNITDDTVIYRPLPASGNDFNVSTHDSTTTAFIIDQNATFFAKDMQGAITMDLGYNFTRTYNQVLNPRYIEFKDFNITYAINPTDIRADLKSGTEFKIFGDKTLDHNVTFVYGRAKPSQDFYDDVIASSIDTPISIVIYCDQDPITCSAVYNINSVLGITDEYNWYRLVDDGVTEPRIGEHVTSENDGNITLVASVGASVAPTDPTAVPINNSGGINNPDVNVTATVTTRPLDVDIDFGTATNRWLIYNEDNNSIPSPFYRVRFIGHNSWVGHGDTGHVVDNNVSAKKNRRLGW